MNRVKSLLARSYSSFLVKSTYKDNLKLFSIFSFQRATIGRARTLELGLVLQSEEKNLYTPYRKQIHPVRRVPPGKRERGYQFCFLKSTPTTQKTLAQPLSAMKKRKVHI